MNEDAWTDEQYRDHARKGARRATIFGLFLGPISAIFDAFSGDGFNGVGGDSFGSAILWVLIGSAFGGLVGFLAGGAGSYVGTYMAKRGDRKPRH